jgi:CDP-diacylglycerol--serine O-phosphatidyltransferase
MKNKLAAIPHFFTISNIFLGFSSIIYASSDKFTTAAWCIVVGAMCDLVDGKIARLTKTYSRFGVELDSLADAITFGVAPAYLIYKTSFINVGIWGIFFTFLYLLAGIFRLARFNTQLKGFTKKSFRGLPIPMAAITVATFIILVNFYWDKSEMLQAFVIMVPGLALLMVSSIEYENIPKLVISRSVKKNFKPLVYYSGFFTIMLYPKQAFFPLILAYIFYGIGAHIHSMSQREEEPEEVIVEDDLIKK